MVKGTNLIPSYPLRLAPELKAEMTACADGEGINLNKAIAKAIRFYLDSKKQTSSVDALKVQEKRRNFNYV